jgi:hypothetical protein
MKKYDYNNMERVDTIKQEKERVLKNKMHKIPASGLRITRLGKVYSKYPFGKK